MIDPEIKKKVNNKLNESYHVIDDMRYNNMNISLDNISDKGLMDLFNESWRIISNYIDNLRSLRNIDIFRLKNLRSFYFQCLFSDRI